MAILTFWSARAEAFDATHDFPSGATFTLNGAAAINADAALIGSLGLDCPTSQDYVSSPVSAGDRINSSVGSIKFTFRITAYSPVQTLVRAYNSASINNHIKVTAIGTDTSTGRELEFRIRRTGGANVAISTTDADLQTGTIYHAVARYSQANGDMRLEIYNADGSLRGTPAENLATGHAVPDSIDTLLFGVSEGAGSPDYHVDGLIIADTYDETLEDNLNVDSYADYGGGGAGATTDIPAAVASLVLAAPQSTVQLAPNVAASVASLVLSAPASVVSLARNIAGNTAVLVLTAPQSDVDLAGAIQAIAGSLVLSALQSTITLSPSVAANSGALILTSPQHQVGTNFDVDAVAGALALTGQQATIALAAAIQAAVATLALNSPQSIVSLQQTVAAAVAGLVLTPQQAAVALAGAIGALPGDLTLAGLEAAIVGATLGLQIDPTRVLLVDPRRPYALVTRRDDAARIGPR